MHPWLKDIADGAAKMSRTKVAHTIDTDCHEIIPNLPLSKVIDRNFRRVGVSSSRSKESAASV